MMNDAIAIVLLIAMALTFLAYIGRLHYQSRRDASDRHSRQWIELRRASLQRPPSYYTPTKNDEDEEESMERMRDEIRSEELGMRSSADVMRMALCESKSVMLRPGQKYLFLPVDGCRTCAAMMREARAAYLGEGDVVPEAWTKQ